MAGALKETKQDFTDKVNLFRGKNGVPVCRRGAAPGRVASEGLFGEVTFELSSDDGQEQAWEDWKEATCSQRVQTMQRAWGWDRQ